MQILKHLANFYNGNIPKKHREVLNVDVLYSLSEAEAHKIQSEERIKKTVTMQDIIEPMNQIFRSPTRNKTSLKRRLAFLAEALDKCVSEANDRDIFDVKRGPISRAKISPVVMREVFVIRDKEQNNSCCISVVQVNSLSLNMNTTKD